MKSYILLQVIILLGKHCLSADDRSNKTPERNSPEMYSSTYIISKLSEKESYLVTDLENYMKTMEGYFTHIKRYISQHKASLSLHNSSATSVYHPVNAFTLLRRHVIDFSELENTFRKVSKFSEDYYVRVRNYKETGYIPTTSDLDGAATGIMRLQHLFQLSIQNLVNGKIKSPLLNKEFHSNSKLTLMDLKIIMKQAFSTLSNYPSHVIHEWYRVAAQMKEGGIISDSLMENKKSEKADSLPAKLPISDSTSYLRLKRPFEWVKQYDDEEEDNYRFHHLCAGEQIMKPSVAKHLRCYYHSPSPSFLIGPLKVEEKSRDPTLIEFHDFITGKEADEFLNKSLATGQFFRSGPGKVNDPFGEKASQFRTSQTAWIDEKNFPLADELSDRISRVVLLVLQNGVTGIGSNRWDFVNSERFQVLNYGIGGVYFVHPDYFHTYIDGHMIGWDTGYGNRIATFMIYLSDVEAGGGTAFPRLGTYVTPRKGKAVFWWNVNRNSEGDDRTWHGGCPVLYGSKFIVNKWIQVRGQMNAAPCGLHPNDTFTYPR